MIEDTLGSSKRMGPNRPLSQNPVMCGNLLPRALYLQ
jgi:hypothetical protein